MLMNHILKLNYFPTGLSKPSNVAKKDFVTKSVYDELGLKNVTLLIQTNKVLKKKLKILIKRYLIAVNLSWLDIAID